MNGDQTTSRELSESAWVELCLKHAAAGSELDLTRDGAGDSPAEADAWPPGRRIPANAIRAALLELQRKPETADPRGLRVRGADIQGRLDLDYMQVPCLLHLVSCRLLKGVSLREGRLPELSLNRSLVASSDQAVVALNTAGTTITGELSLRGTSLTNEGGMALFLNGAKIGGNALLDEGFTAAGEIWALKLTITGHLSLRGTTLTNKDGIALAMDCANIDGGAMLSDGFTATGEVRALGATVAGPLILSGAKLVNEYGVALGLDGTTLEVARSSTKGSRPPVRSAHLEPPSRVI